MTTVQVSIDAIAEGTIFEVNGEELYKTPRQYTGFGDTNGFPTPSELYHDILGKIGMEFRGNGGYNYPRFRDYVGNIFLRDINAQNYSLSWGDLIGIQLTSPLRGNGDRDMRPLRVMIKNDNTINLTLLRNKIAQLQAEYDFSQEEWKAEEIRYEAQRAIVGSLQDKLSDLHGVLEYAKAKYSVDHYSPDSGFDMKLKNLTEEQVLFIADIVKAWNTLEVKGATE